jgi:hypothetical protein
MFHTLVKGISCYGKLMDNSNFHVVCEDEEDDSVWCDGNPESEDYTFQDWEDVVDCLNQHYASPIVEITAV